MESQATRHKLTNVLSHLALLLLLVSCSISGPLRVDRNAQNYKFQAPSSDWEQRPPLEGADFFFENKKSGATLSVSSICERYEEASLVSLANSALSPLGFYKEKERRSLTVDGREALGVYVESKLDGVAVEVELVVMRKNDCLFDFSLQSAPKISNSERKEFLKSLESFRYSSATFKNVGS